MAFKIVLVEPEIPNNTGNIGRLALASGSELHLIKPYGFELTDKRVKRAGLDYWKHVPLFEYESYADFIIQHKETKLMFFSSHGVHDYTKAAYENDCFLVFGKESVGLHEDILKEHKDNTYSIPILSKHVRSLNIANAVSIVVYEGLKQIEEKL